MIEIQSFEDEERIDRKIWSQYTPTFLFLSASHFVPHGTSDFAVGPAETISKRSYSPQNKYFIMEVVTLV